MNNITMKPMNVIGIIDQTIKLYRNNFKAIILFVLLIGGTANLIVALIGLGANAATLESPLSRLLQGEFSLETLMYSFIGAGGTGQSNAFSDLLDIIVSVFLYPLVAGGVTFIALTASHGTVENSYMSKVSPKYGSLLVTFLAMIALYLAFFIAVLILVALFSRLIFLAVIIIMGLFVFIALPLTAFCLPVAIQEERYGFAWLPRAWGLYKSKTGKTIGLLLLTFLFVQILTLVLTTLFALFPPLISTVGTVLITALLEPVTLIAAALLYLDIRMTAEGYDLELRLAALENKEESGAYV